MTMSAPEDVKMEEPAPPAQQAETQQAETQPPLTKLQSQIDALTEFSTRLQKLRQLPPLLLRPESDPIGSSLPDVLRRALLEAHGARTALLEDTVQGAFKAAAESESRDRVGIRGNARRDRRRRKRSPTPESPRPFPAFRPKTTSLFPTTSTESSLTLSQLPEYIRTFNAAHTKKAVLHIWLSSSRDSRDLRVPVVIRFLIPDVLRAFITVGHADGENDTPAEDRPLLIENITAFGTRERKPPHSQSDYLVFQKLSQQILRMIQSTPRVPVQTLMDMLTTYQSLFSEQCSACQRVLSAEGYIPPVARVWLEQEGKPGVWVPRHVTCLGLQS